MEVTIIKITGKKVSIYYMKSSYFFEKFQGNSLKTCRTEGVICAYTHGKSTQLSYKEIKFELSKELPQIIAV